MDLGTSGWTEFHMSEDVAAYMAENIELFDYDMGLVHSHHTMGAFFSGQDTKMLQQEGSDTNCFVSLVVDTRGTYVAAITRKIVTKSEVAIKNLGSSYEFFGDGTKEVESSTPLTTKVISKEVIEYSLLDVERHIVNNSLSYLDTRFEEIANKKKLDEITKNNARITFDSPILSNKEPWLFGDKEMKSTEKFTAITSKDNEKINSSLTWTPNPKLIRKAAITIISCSMILNPDKFDMKQWITKHMNNVYEKTFGEGGSYYSTDERITSFEEWKDFILQFTLDYFYDPDTPADIEYEDYYNAVVQALYDELFPYSDNKYILEYCMALESNML